MKNIFVLLFAIFVVYCKCQRLSLGKCPRYRTMKKFDPKKFEGKWYEVERSFYLLEIASSCTSLYFAPRPSGAHKVTIKTVNRWTGSPSVSIGTATPISNTSAVLNYKVSTKLPGAVARMLPGAGTYSVLYTDYDNVAILWSCSDLAFMHADLLWVLGRTRDLPVTARAEVYNQLTLLGIDSDRLTLSRNEDCPSFK